MSSWTLSEMGPWTRLKWIEYVNDMTIKNNDSSFHNTAHLYTFLTLRFSNVNHHYFLSSTTKQSIDYMVDWPVNTLRLRQKGCHFADSTFKCIFLNENHCILILISLRFVSKGPINDMPALVQVMAWAQTGDKPLSEQWWLVYWTHIWVTQLRFLLDVE